MFFTKFAKAAAYFIVVISILNIGVGFMVANDANQTIFSNPGRVIDMSIMGLFAGLVLGVLSEISTNLSK